jgi:hypothetical protein
MTNKDVTRLSALKRHWSGRFQVLLSPEQRTGQRHKLQNFIERKGKRKRKHHKGSGGLCKVARKP